MPSISGRCARSGTLHSDHLTRRKHFSVVPVKGFRLVKSVYGNSMTESTENLQTYEDLFAHRFTSEDREYQEYVKRPADPPPIIEDWRGRGGGNQRGRDNRYQDRHGHRGRGWGGGGGGHRWEGERGWRGEQRGQPHWNDGDRDRHWGHGSGYQSGHQSTHHSYNSNVRRPHYDRY